MLIVKEKNNKDYKIVNASKEKLSFKINILFRKSNIFRTNSIVKKGTSKNDKEYIKL